MTSCLGQLRQKILPPGELGCSWGKRSPREPRGPQHGQYPLLPGCWPTTAEKREPGDCDIHQPAGDHQTRWISQTWGPSRKTFWEQWEAGMGTWLEHRSGVPLESPIRKPKQKETELPPTRLSQDVGSVLKWGSLPMGRECMGSDVNRGLCVPLTPWQCPSPFKGQ